MKIKRKETFSRVKQNMVGLLNDSDSDDELPPGWEERASLDGNVYYVKY